MKNLRHIALVTALISWFSAAADISFQNINVETGLSQTTVFAIYQDEIGRMWFGTRDGLNCFDGSGIKVFKPTLGDTTSLFANNVEELTGDGQGSIFLRCKNGAMVLDIKTERFSAIAYSNITAIEYAEKGLLLASKNQILAYDKATDKLTPLCTISDDKTILITSLKQRPNGDIYIGTRRSGVLVFRQGKVTQLIDNIGVYKLFTDSKENVWIGSRQDGLFKICPDGTIGRYTAADTGQRHLPSHDAHSIMEDNLSNIYVGALNGLYKLDPEQGFQRVNITRNHEGWSNNSVMSLIKDAQGTIWAGMYYGGVSYFNPEHDRYVIYRSDDITPTKLSSSNIGRMVEDSSGNIWICTESGGLNYFDRSTNRFVQYTQSTARNSISSNVIKSLHIDEQNPDIIWVGTAFSGLNRFDVRSGSFTRIENDSYYLADKGVYSVRNIIQRGDTLFLGTHQGMDMYIKSLDRFYSMAHLGGLAAEKRQIIDMVSDKERGVIWASNSRGIFEYDIKANKSTGYNYSKVISPNSFNLVGVICLDKDGNPLLGTSGAGIIRYNRTLRKFEPYRLDNPAIDNGYIVAMMRSRNSNLVVATNQGLFIIDSSSGKTKMLNFFGGFPLGVINDFSLLSTSDSNIFVGGIAGLVAFKEGELEYTPQSCHLNIVDVSIDNTPLDAKNYPIKAAFLDKITIESGQKTVSVRFATTNYVKQSHTRVEYRLTGFEQKWVDAGERREITYTNLSPGNYTLQIRAWEQEQMVAQRQMKIFVATPIYISTLAIMIYILLLGALTYTLMRIYTSRVKLRSSLELERAKQSFFINISHEFRTPLTLIIGHTESLLQLTTLSLSARKLAQSIAGSAQHTHRLIDELMDFSKLEAGGFSLKVSKVDITTVLQQIYLSFKEYADYRNIEFQFLPLNHEVELYVDMNQIEKVFYNIVGNAFNYTDNGGKITLSVQSTDSDVYIRVEDSGIGIAQDKITHIFDRYYRIGNPKDGSRRVKGTGIGLFYAKSIVEAHSGRIDVVSQPAKGSIFTVTLRKGREHLANVDISDETATIKSNLSYITTPDDEFISKIETVQPDGEQIKLLIVEDNIEMAQMLRDIFSSVYCVRVATDGQQGLAQALSFQPDLIISDVMMPVMSGIELCQRLKTDAATSHIPVILLTAKVGAENKIEGLGTGADDYITKPFNIKELMARCNNIITNRHILQRRFSQQVNFSPDLLTNNSLDHKFLEQLHKIAEENLSNTDFSIDVICREVGLGRTNLFAKVKALTGMTPNDLVLNIRLKRAMELVVGTQLTISEIAYDTGFNSSSYFIKCFKRLFGKTPQEFRKE